MKLPVISPSLVSKTPLEPNTPPPSAYPDEHPNKLPPISGELKLSMTYLRDLESLLMRSPYLVPKIKEALHQIKKSRKVTS